MTVTVRFAPSPTGRIHIGNARAALINHLFARQHDGCFILRFDDTDQERSSREYARGISEDLDWLGIRPDRVIEQSTRFSLYDAAATRLRDSGRLYPCYETADELERKRKRQLAHGLPPVYDRAALKLSAEDRIRLEAEGRRPHWRFRLKGNIVRWNDLIRGVQTVNTSSLSDPVLIREDGTYLYTLPSVIDDVDLGITHVVRGEDHVTNTGVQMDLFDALGLSTPGFAHYSLLMNAEGEGLSKRSGALSIAELRDEGIESMAIASFVARIGTSQAIVPDIDMSSLIETFDIKDLSRAPSRFSRTELRTLNARLLHQCDFADIASRLKEIDLPVDERFWHAVRGNLTVLTDAKQWAQTITGTIEPIVEEQIFLTQAAQCLPEEPWDEHVWTKWCSALKTMTGRKGRALFHPLRLALTGVEAGPELALLLPLIGREKCLKRLSGRRG